MWIVRARALPPICRSPSVSLRPLPLLSRVSVSVSPFSLPPYSPYLHLSLCFSVSLSLVLLPLPPPPSSPLLPNPASPSSPTPSPPSHPLPISPAKHSSPHPPQMHDALSHFFTSRLRPHQWVHIRGSTPPSQRGKFVRRFQSDEHCTLAVLSLKGCSHGLNLEVAQSVVFTELCWTPAELEQAGVTVGVGRLLDGCSEACGGCPVLSCQE